MNTNLKVRLKMQLPLQPNQPLKSASHSRFAQQIRTVYTHIELDIIALDSHLAQFLTSENVLKIHKIHDRPSHYTDHIQFHEA